MKMKKRWAWGMTALLALGCGTGEGEQGVSSSALTRVTTKSTPQDLFRGLFFGRGPVAALLPQIWAAGNPGAPKPPPAPTTTELAKQLEAETEALAKAGLSAADQQSLHALASGVRKDSLSADQLAQQVSVDVSAAGKQPFSDADVTRVMALLNKRDPRFFTRFASQIQSGDPIQVSSAVQDASVQLIGITANPSYRPGESAPIDGFANGLDQCLYGSEATIGWLLTMKDVDQVTSVLINNYVVVDIVTQVAQVAFSRAFANSADELRHEAWMRIITADLKG